MDPITEMMQEFAKSWHRFQATETVRLFRIDTDPRMHHDLARLLRGLEMAPSNRSPYLIIDAPFANRMGFYQAAVEKLKADYARIREGFAKDGVTLGALSVEAGPPEETFARHVLGVWALVEGQLDGLMIVLLPATIADGGEWSWSVEDLIGRFESTKVRVAAADAPAGFLAGLSDNLARRCITGKFFVSDRTVQEYLMKVAAGGWAAVAGGGKGPGGGAPPAPIPAPRVLALPKRARSWSPAPGAAAPAVARPTEAPPSGPGRPEEPPAAAGVGSGPKILAPEEAARLRTLMATAAAASAEQEPRRAIAALREASELCRANGLPTEQAIVLMAIGNTLLATGEPGRAIETYQEAAAIASGVPTPVVGAQARLALGSTLFREQKYDEAAVVYEQAAADAAACQSEILRLEALRMAGTCHNLRNRPEEASRCWSIALEAGQHMSPAERQFSTFGQVGAAFVALCRKQGLEEQARSVAQQIEAMKRQATA